MAIRQLLVYLNEGYEWIVDFDNVPQDRLMSCAHDIIKGGDTESLIRKFLKAGVMTAQGRAAKKQSLVHCREEIYHRSCQRSC